MKQLILTGLVLGVSALAIASAANADTIVNNESDYTVFVTNQSPGSAVTLRYWDVLKTTPYLADACGVIKIPTSTTQQPNSFSFGLGTQIQAVSLQVQTRPKCTNRQLAEPRPANFKDLTGNLYVVGQTPSAATSINVSFSRDRKATVNSCGFAKFAKSAAYPHIGQTFVSGPEMGTTGPRLLNELQILENPGPICRSGAMMIPYKL